MPGSFWKNKSVMVTGGNGFIAQRLIKFLLLADAHIVSVVKNKKSNQEFRAVVLVECDIKDSQNLKVICEKYKIDTIFHLAASATVSGSDKGPEDAIINNYIGTLRVLEAARLNGIARVIIASSDKVYGDHSRDQIEPLPCCEKYALRGIDTYGVSKAGADLLAQYYRQQHGVPVVIVRASNIYGPGDLNLSRLFPNSILSLLGNIPPVIYTGSSSALREYVYVDDLVGAYLYLAENTNRINENYSFTTAAAKGSCAFNIGHYNSAQLLHLEDCEHIKSVAEIVNYLRVKIRDVTPLFKEKPKNFIEISSQYSDASKLLSFGFIPGTSFENGVMKTIEWYMNNFDRMKSSV